ncbi:MAG TPA: SagB family peptide dehydrogenase [Gaiellaceae bacterium]|nr:SagB family peptide dehydrogenase [Gaiellaceae bacterium]
MSAPARTPRTVAWAPWVYGDGGPALDDPAELYHEASKLSAAYGDPRVRGLSLLETSRELRASVVRATRRSRTWPRRCLPEAVELAPPLGPTIRRRRSERAFAEGALAAAEVATLLEAAYGVTACATDETPPLRAVPSAGALYPLELYLLARSVRDVPAGVYHYDPLDRSLGRLGADPAAIAGDTLTPYAPLVDEAAIVVAITAVFWRTRFKYGLRGFRFALLEAGHAAQNLLLAATALELASVALGGFYDRALERLLQVDGVNESVVYAVSVGRAT